MTPYQIPADVSGSDGSTGKQSRPVSDATDPQADHTHPTAAADSDKASAAHDSEVEVRPTVELKRTSVTPERSSPSNDRKMSNAQLVALRGTYLFLYNWGWSSPVTLVVEFLCVCVCG